jgi:3-dehydroquinate synthase
MAAKRLDICLSPVGSSYSVTVGDGMLSGCGTWAQRCLGKQTSRLVIVSNPAIYSLYGTETADNLRSAGFEVSHYLLRDGERYKSLRTAEAAIKSFTENGLRRTDAVVALGGGVVGDLAGFASAVYLRGIPFLQIPTTLLSMVDSSVGGKTGVNSKFGKNLIGSFHQPSGVLIDVNVLRTLPQRELTAGLCEMIKHGAIGGKALLDRTDKLLVNYPISECRHFENSDFRSEIANLIAANVEFKAKIVAGDERESSKRLDGKSRKILNFGHTLAHALEKVTDYEYFRHGEAVGYGILFAAELSNSLAQFDEKELNLLYDVVHRAGPLPPLAHIQAKEVFGAFRFDKKQLSGSLQMVLLKSIGKPVIVVEEDIPRTSFSKAFKNLLQRSA